MRFLIARDYNTADCYRYRVRRTQESVRAITIGDNTAISERTIDHCFIDTTARVWSLRGRSEIAGQIYAINLKIHANSFHVINIIININM